MLRVPSRVFQLHPYPHTQVHMWNLLVDDALGAGLQLHESCPFANALALQAAHAEAQAEITAREIDAVQK